MLGVARQHPPALRVSACGHSRVGPSAGYTQLRSPSVEAKTSPDGAIGFGRAGTAIADGTLPAAPGGVNEVEFGTWVQLRITGPSIWRRYRRRFSLGRAMGVAISFPAGWPALGRNMRIALELLLYQHGQFIKALRTVDTRLRSAPEPRSVPT